MWAAIAFVVLAAIGVLVVLRRAAREEPVLQSHPWNLYDIAKLHIPVMAGLAGFAVTGVVLITSLSRTNHGRPLTTVLVMFLAAYLFYIGTAFLISYLPQADTAGDLVPRIHFSLATTIEYRTVFLSWFALRPLMEVNDLDGPANVLTVLLPVSLLVGSTIVAMAADGLGLIRLVETYFSAVLVAALAVGYAGFVWLAVPGARSAHSTLAITLVVFALNSLGFAAAALTPLAARYELAARAYRRFGRRLIVADMQLTMLSLTLLWLAVVRGV